MGTTEQRQTLDLDFVEEFSQRYERAWESRDAEAIAASCTEDVEWVDPALNEPLYGRDNVRRFATATFRMVPDFKVETLDRPYLSLTRERVLSPYRMSGTMTGPWEFLDLAPTGRPFSIEGIDSWEMRDGLIARYSTFYDNIDMSRQLGVLPPAGSGPDRVMSRVQHVQARFQRRFAR